MYGMMYIQRRYFQSNFLSTFLSTYVCEPARAVTSTGREGGGYEGNDELIW